MCGKIILQAAQGRDRRNPSTDFEVTPVAGICQGKEQEQSLRIE
jgi:hypothetical protein